MRKYSDTSIMSLSGSADILPSQDKMVKVGKNAGGVADMTIAPERDSLEGIDKDTNMQKKVLKNKRGY